MITDKPIAQITGADLQQLIADAVMEGKRIEYKQAFSLDKDDGKRKFLASIASFANASGGDLIFGIQAESGKPISILPLENFDPDAIKRRLADMIRDGIEPAIFGIEYQEIPISSGHALLIRIPKSYAGAHMVTYNKDHRFYARGVNGRVPMDVAEVKASFILSETMGDRIRKWRMERLGNILADETPCRLKHPARIVAHLMPVRAFDSLFKADLSTLAINRQHLVPIYTSGWSTSLDFDGWYAYCGGDKENAEGYTYAMRNGCVEAVDTNLLSNWMDTTKKIIPNVAYEERLIQFLPTGIELLKQMGNEPPFFLALSLVNVRGYAMGVSSNYWHHKSGVIGRDHLYLSEVFLESFQLDAAKVLQESFDRIWNACGWPRSHNYTQENEWKPVQ